MAGIVCKIVSCPFYCQGFCGRGITIINNAGLCDEVVRAQRIGWEPHSLVDEYGSRVYISTVTIKEEDENDDISREGSDGGPSSMGDDRGSSENAGAGTHDVSVGSAEDDRSAL